MRNRNAIKISLKRRKEKQKQKYALGKMSKQATQEFIKFLCKSCEFFEKARGAADPHQNRKKKNKNIN